MNLHLSFDAAARGSLHLQNFAAFGALRDMILLLGPSDGKVAVVNPSSALASCISEPISGGSSSVLRTLRRPAADCEPPVNRGKRCCGPQRPLIIRMRT